MQGSREERDQKIKKNQRKFDDDPRGKSSEKTRSKFDKPRRGNEADFNPDDLE